MPLYNYWQMDIEFLPQINIFLFSFLVGCIVLVGRGLTSVHCPLVCTISMTQGSDLFSVSRSSRALQDTRSSTLETQVAGPLRLVAGEVASWTSFILVQSTTGFQPAEQCSVRLVAARLMRSTAAFRRGSLERRAHTGQVLTIWHREEKTIPLSPVRPNQAQSVRAACQSSPCTS